MAYFSTEYREAKMPPGPSQDERWNDSCFDSFCDAQVKEFGIDPVRLFLLKDIKPRQDTYRMAATLRRCEVDVQLCYKANADVEAAAATVVQDLRRAVVSVQNGSTSQGRPPFVDVWKRSTVLQESSTVARETVLHECFAEMRESAIVPDASEEYHSA